MYPRPKLRAVNTSVLRRLSVACRFMSKNGPSAQFKTVKLIAKPAEVSLVFSISAAVRLCKVPYLRV